MRRTAFAPRPLPCLLLLLTLLTLLSAPSVLAPLACKDYTGWRVVRAWPRSQLQQLQVQRQVEALGAQGAAELWRRRPAVDVLVRPDAADSLLAFLQARAVPASVQVVDVGEEIRRELNAHTVRSGSDRANVLTSYLRHPEINDFLDDLRTHYPDLVKVFQYGESYEGRPLVGVEVSSGGGGTKPVILVDAGIHAREWIAPSMALYLIQELVENPENADLLEGVDWHVLPMLNPDGYEYSHSQDRMWRKTRSRNDHPVCLGADPNRNFDYFWGVSGVSWDPCKETYAGPAPFSELEALALAHYGMGLHGRLRLYVSIHSYGGMFIHPWGYKYEQPEDEAELKALAAAVAEAVHDAGIERFVVGNCFETLGEIAAGGSDDFMKAVAGANFSYTLEMPVPSFTTPASDIAGYVVPMFQAFRAMGLYIRDLFHCC